MATTDWETASRCPKCGMPGDDRSQTPGRNRTTIHMIYCVNNRCKWFETNWIVQVNSDGSIPVRAPRREREPKTFEPLRGMTTEKARRIVEQEAKELGDERAR